MYSAVAVSIKTVRAVGAELAWRMIKPMLIIGVIFAALLLVFGGWLTTQHELWWILQFIFITSIMFFVLLSVVILTILRYFTPLQNDSQKQAVGNFVDKLQRVSDTLGISNFALLFRIVRDVVRPQEKTFIEQVTEDSTTLHTDFIKLQKQFKNNKQEGA